MSSNEDDNEEYSQNKKRRVQRACDVCRRKKIRCDGIQMPKNRCSNCIAYNFDCTYVEAAKKRGPPKGYVESLEIRIERMDELLHRLMPEADFTQELGSRFSKENWTIDKPHKTHRNIPEIVRNVRDAMKHNCGPIGNQAITGSVEEQLLEEELQHLTLEDGLEGCDDRTSGYRFFGKSSGAQLIRTAMDMKHTYTGESSNFVPSEASTSRAEFWSYLPWENADHTMRGGYPTYSFPDPDLMHSLIELYFARLNIFMPLLHRPSFKRSVSEGLHLRDDMFAAVLLLVCACASRYSDDDRVLLDGETSRHSSGWKWFDQVQVIRKSLFTPPGLYDLQVYCLFTEFLSGSSAPQASWTMVGVGIRLAQDVGAHRRKKNAGNTLEAELWKRAFWILVMMDRVTSSTLGRPCAIHDEDIDIDFPAECDDEYWEHPDPEQAFKQPSGKPSYVSYFITYLRLNQLVAFCLRTIYSLNKSKILLGIIGQKWEQNIVAELDSALNKWVDSIPDHLRWDPNRENLLHFDQSAHLYISYYHLQILIHRPFIPTPRNPSPLSFPSLAICTNAARSCSHVVDIQSRRSSVMPSIGMSAFTAGIVLLFNVWGGQRSGLSIDPKKEIGDVHKCMRMLRTMESRWHVAGRLWDILYELASAGDLPLPNTSPVPNNKRERDSDSPLSQMDSPVSSSNNETDASSSLSTRAIAGTRRVASKHDMNAASKGNLVKNVAPLIPPIQSRPVPPQPPPFVEQSDLFSLPTSSHDLGRIPLHGAFECPDQPTSHERSDWFASSVLPSVAQPTVPTTDFGYLNTAFFGLAENTGQLYSDPQQSQPYDYGSANTMFGMNNSSDASMEVNDTLAMWSNAPSGFELEHWGTYLNNVSDIAHGAHHPGDDIG